MFGAANSWWTPWHKADGAFILHGDPTPDSGREARAAHLPTTLSGRAAVVLFRIAHTGNSSSAAPPLRIGLAERLGCACDKLSRGCLEHGIPYARIAGRRVRTAFNVNRSGRHGLIVQTSHACVGVDVEERKAA